MSPAALGFRSHSGWAIAVCAARPGKASPLILDRRRIVTARVKQPYHAAEPLPFAEAETLIRECRATSIAMAMDAIRPLLAVHSPCAAAVLVGRVLALPPLASILKSHAMIHTAEGVFYREILIEACEQLGLPVVRVPEKDVAGGLPGLARPLGPPWTQDHKLATLAALAALAPGR